MHNKTRESSRQANLFVLICLSMMTILLIWNAALRVDNFDTRQSELAEHSAHAAADEITLLINGYKRAVHIFAEDNQAYIRSMAEWPQDAGLYAILRERITTFFPEHFTFTIADPDGNIVLKGFDGRIGPQCRQDLRKFAASGGEQPVYIHRGEDDRTTHFDVMARWGGAKPDGGIFFISFRTDTLLRTLANTGVAGHDSYLLHHADAGLVELAVTGSGEAVPGGTRLGSNTMRRVSQTLPVPGTLWNVAILPNQSLYPGAYSSILVQCLIIFIGFLVISIIMRMLLLNE